MCVHKEFKMLFTSGLQGVSPRTIHYRSDYTKPQFYIQTVDMVFDLDPSQTRVRSTIRFERADKNADPLILVGESLELISVKIDNKLLTNNDYTVDASTLTIHVVPDVFILETIVVIDPENNKSLNGLYISNGCFTTQCEPHGFRCITYFLDRPDILSIFRCKIIADKAQFPMLLSNGNRVAHGELDDGKHWVEWHDPSLKPCYLFALVAGDFDCVKEDYVTMYGRTVSLEVLVERGKAQQAEFALYSLKEAMKWDERVFGREYDLSVYMIVAVSDFNFGAMENKGLNIFNDQFVLANPKLATDVDYTNILGVVGHEYFHNWSGNRVTCRDWFQLSLKEGLTIFRDQRFTADLTSPIAKRIADIYIMQNHQFIEDAGPLSHPIRPDSYVSMNNFYTATVYNKGAEVIRMLRTIIGDTAFSEGMNHYFATFDGQAVTTDDFVTSMEIVSKSDLTQFRRWYGQKGTPCVHITTHYDSTEATFTISLRQTIAEKQDYAPLHIPLAFGLLDSTDGHPLSFSVLSGNVQDGNDCPVIQCIDFYQEVVLGDVRSKPVLSILRNFSAPILLDYAQPTSEQAHLLKYDTDWVNRWQMATALIEQQIKQAYDALSQDAIHQIPDSIIQAFDGCIRQENVDGGVLNYLFALPTIKKYLLSYPGLNVLQLDAAYKQVQQQLATKLQDAWLALYQRYTADKKPYAFDKQSVSDRAARNLALYYLTLADSTDIEATLYHNYEQADNMTDMIGVLTAAIKKPGHIKTKLLNSFYKTFRNEPLVIDKWFRLQALDSSAGAIERIKQLLVHEAYDKHNPNRVRALLGVFSAQNIAHFHAADEQGYALLVTEIASIDKFNPQLAARLCEPLLGWRLFDTDRQVSMKKYLQLLLSEEQISDDLYEVVSKSLATTVA